MRNFKPAYLRLSHNQRAKLPSQPEAERLGYVPSARHHADEARRGQSQHHRQSERRNQQLPVLLADLNSRASVVASVNALQRPCCF
jgi:hypothetical protein